MLALVVNGVAAALFIVISDVSWQAAGIIALGSVLGGQLGARVGRRLPAPALRTMVAVIGTIAIVKLVWFD